MYILVLLQILGTNGDDFFGTNVVAPFPNGVSRASAVVIVRNDAVPEGNETFTVQITGARFGAEIGERNTMQLIIRANDEPHGAFQFNSVSAWSWYSHFISLIFVHETDYLISSGQLMQWQIYLYIEARFQDSLQENF